jgi:hypothetical protein
VETVSEEPYRASGRRPEVLPPAALAWAAALGALGLGVAFGRSRSSRPAPAPAWSRPLVPKRRRPR